MGNRSKYLAVTAAASSAMIAARRRARLRRAAAGIQDAILPTHTIGGLPSDRAIDFDDAHASGHRHVGPADRDEPNPEPTRRRPGTKHAHRMTHPFSGG